MFAITVRLSRYISLGSMLGSVTRYQLDCGGTLIHMEALNHENRHLQLGEEVTVRVSEKDVLFIHE